MKKSTWDIIAPFYKIQILRDKSAYEEIFKLISNSVTDKVVLELATGPGLISKNIACCAKKVIATDYSEKMIKEAKKGIRPENLNFTVVDASDIPYETDSFDVVIIANALHIVKDTGVVLSEIKRVLRKDGIFIAPNYVHNNLKGSKKFWIRMLEIIGVKFNYTWGDDEYKIFIEQNGFKVLNFKVIPAKIPIVYIESTQDT